MSKCSVGCGKIKIFLLVGLVCFVMAGCSGQKASLDFEVQPVDYQLDLGKGETANLCYANEKKDIFAVGIRNEAVEGPLTDTKRIQVYDMEKEHVTETYPVQGNCYVMQAVPYQEGIVFVQYENALVDTEWSIIYADKEGQACLDRGRCDSYESIPGIGLLGETVVYTYENTGESYTWGVKKLSDMTAQNLFSEHGGKCYTPLYTNGEKYCFLIGRENSEFATMIVGDLNGEAFRHDLTQRVDSFGITKDYAVCSVSDGRDNTHLVKVQLRDGSSEVLEKTEPMYMLTGGSGQTAMYVSTGLQAYMTDITGDSTKRIEFPDDSEYHQTLGIYPAGTEKYIVEINEERYYLVYKK